MVTNVKSLIGVRRRNLLFVSLLTVVLVVSLFIYAFVVGVDNSSLEADVHVKTEAEFVDAIDNAVGSIIIALNNDIVLTEKLTISSNKDITLTSNKTNGFYKLIGTKRDSTITIEKAGMLTLKGITITHNYDVIGSGVYVESGGTLVMVDGKISDNKAGWGGGVFNYGTFKMSGGEISGNSVYPQPSFRGSRYDVGGGVENRGTFTMSGGKIYGNTAHCGGGVCNYGTFKMSGGIISGNTAIIDSDIHNDKRGASFNWCGGIVFGNIDILGVTICVGIIIGVVAFLYFKKKGKLVSKQKRLSIHPDLSQNCLEM